MVQTDSSASAVYEARQEWSQWVIQLALSPQESLLMPNHAEEPSPSQLQPDLSKPILNAEKHVRRAMRWCYSVLTFTVGMLGGASAFLYFIGDSLNSWAKTGLSASLSLLCATLIREFSHSLKRSREVEDLIVALGICAACGNSPEIQRILKKMAESLSNGNQAKRPWLRRVTSKDKYQTQ
jgi:hypothetical protein